MNIQILVAVTAIILTLMTKSAVSLEILRVGYIERPPHIYANADGSTRGLTGKRLVALFDQARIPVELVRTFQEDIEDYIGTPGLDALIVTKTLIETPADYIFSQSPLFTLQFYAYHLDTQPRLSDLEDLHDTAIILPIPLHSFKGPLKQQIVNPTNNVSIIAEEPHLNTQITMLRQHKAHYAISYLGENNAALMFGDRASRNGIVISKLFHLPMYLVIKRSYPNAQAVMQELNQVLAVDTELGADSTGY